ncbi:MAG: riboflavin synthase [Pseudomonadota bacterium]|nr:riboflavin synthase [Pseudomonadota bacterium]
MFTGLVSDLGEVLSANNGRMRISCGYEASTISVGASIACDGCCLTAVAVEPRKGGGSLFAVDVSPETLSRTTLGEWNTGRRVNLERPLTLQSELGGHMVTGHIDGMATIASVTDEGNARRYTIDAPPELARFIAEKGSVALDGTSLTVNDVTGNRFGVMLIPHTLSVTAWAFRKAGDRVNLEVDLLARYVARISQVV